MELRWHREAQAEADAAAAFYREQQPGLEQRFLDSLEDGLRRIQRNPSIYRQIDDGIRKCRLAYFPFGIVYRPGTNFIEIISVMHLRRSPGYWKSRS